MLKKDAEITPTNPKGYGYFLLATNVAEDKISEAAVSTILRPFIKKEEQINKIIRENNGYCQLDLYIKQGKNTVFPDITLSKNALKLLSSLNAQYKLNHNDLLSFLKLNLLSVLAYLYPHVMLRIYIL